MMRLTKMARAVTLASTVVIASGCSTIQEQVTDKISFQLEGVDATVSLQNDNTFIPDLVTNLGVSVKIGNDSPIPLHLLRVNYSVFMGETLVGEGANEDSVKVQAGGGSETITLNISLSGKQLLTEGFKLTRDEKIPAFRIEGAGIVASPVGDYPVPFTLKYNEDKN